VKNIFYDVSRSANIREEEGVYSKIGYVGVHKKNCSKAGHFWPSKDEAVLTSPNAVRMRHDE
jgi:hypothetical protein